jgi:hypothetical protein
MIIENWGLKQDKGGAEETAESEYEEEESVNDTLKYSFHHRDKGFSYLATYFQSWSI